MESDKQENNLGTTEKIIFILLSVFLFVIIFGEYRLSQERIFSFGTREEQPAALHPKIPKNGNETDFIQSWMTFDYVNRIFALPPEYLREKLSITDHGYPRLTLAKYLKEKQSESATTSLLEIQNIVRAYFSPQEKP